MKIAAALLIGVAALFLYAAFGPAPQWDSADGGVKGSWAGRLGEMFRPPISPGDLTPGCFDRKTGTFHANPLCVTRVQCSSTRFRFLDVRVAKAPIRVDFRPTSPTTPAEPKRPCDDDGGLSPISIDLTRADDSTTLVIPKSGGTITVSCLGGVLACSASTR